MDDIKQWTCEKRGVCKARIHTRDNVLIKPTFIHEIEDGHTHGSDPARIVMLKGYNYVKQRSINSEESTRAILSIEIEQMPSSSIAKLPNLDSVKRTIRNYKKVSQVSCGNPTCAAEILIPSKYEITLKQEPFLLYDSGYGDNKRMIVFTTPKFLSLLQQSNKWYADGTFKVVPEYFFQLYTIHAEKDQTIALVLSSELIELVLHNYTL